MTMSVKTDHPVHEFISNRWSPYSFSTKPVKKNDLLSLFEATRWAPSAHNEQPRHYIVATKEDPEEFERLLSCLVDPNKAWAKFVPVLALGVTKLNFSYNDQPNRAALHDLGLASANLLFEAGSRGLHVHQMIGILPEKARELYEIPEAFEVVTAIAIGYLGENADLPENLKKRDDARKPRKPLREFIFSGKWNQSASIVK